MVLSVKDFNYTKISLDSEFFLSLQGQEDTFYWVIEDVKCTYKGKNILEEQVIEK